MDILENILNFKRELLKVTRGESDGTIAEAFSMLDAIEMKFNPLVENSELWGDGRWSEPSTEITIIYRLLILVGYNASIRNLLDSLYMVTHDLNSATINLSSDDILVAMNNWKRYNASCIIERRVYVHYINAAMREAGNTVFTFAYDRECAEKECTKHLTTIKVGEIIKVYPETWFANILRAGAMQVVEKLVNCKDLIPKDFDGEDDQQVEVIVNSILLREGTGNEATIKITPIPPIPEGFVVSPFRIDDSEAARGILAKDLEGDELNVRVHPKVIMAADINQLADQTTKEFETRRVWSDAPTGSTMHYGKPQQLSILQKILEFKESILTVVTKGTIDIDTYVKIVNNSVEAIEDEVKFVPDRLGLGKEGSLELRLINSIRGGLECDKKSLAIILDKLISVTTSIIKNPRTYTSPTNEQPRTLYLANRAYEVYCIVDPVDYKEPNKEKDTKPDTSTEILPESGRVKEANTPMSKHEVLTRLSVMQEQLLTANQALTNLVTNTLRELDATIAEIKRDLLN
jgi:hypothetical protein